METTYNIDYYIKKFEAIPHNLWITGRSYLENDTSKRCAFGHCCDSDLRMGNELHTFNSIVRSEFGIGIPFINDGKHEKYQQSTPKERVLAALYDIKKKQDTEFAQKIANNNTFNSISYEKILEKELIAVN